MNILKSLTVFLLSITITQCGSSQQSLQKVNFDGGDSYYQKWVAGVQGGGSGVNVFFDFTDIPQEIKLHQAFFQGMVTTIEKENDSYVASFKTDLNNERDLVMSNDPVEEMVNTPSVNEDFMYPLAPFEVGITYMYKGALQFAKISNIKEKESIPLPSQRPQNGRDKGQE